MTSEKNRRWEIEEAVDKSGLHPFGRLLLRVILSNADAQTGIIPDQFQPSITSLQSRTGICRRSVIHHLDVCDGSGWLKRQRKRGCRTKYQLTIPESEGRP